VQRLLAFLLALVPALAPAQDLASPPAPVAAPAAAPWNAHVQATFVRQWQPAFAAAVDGPHSLRDAAGASWSFTGTASFGLRLGRAAELYVDPELAAGVPLSGLAGLAAFPDAELAKTSGARPQAYLARLFVRRVVGLGGAPVAVEDAADQLPGSVDARRLVVTAGRFSALDVFDANPVAHDPRTQFLNWALATHAAYDYPADARGYTDGLALELDDGPWSLRAARLAEPRVPNGLALDAALRTHHGDQLELARAWALDGRAGDLRLLAFRARAVMARYADALAAAPAGSPPSLAAVRGRVHDKSGLGVDLDQQLGATVTVFLRAMRADGRTETEAFTEADDARSAGGRLAGAAWARPDDVVGLALLQDRIDAAHRAYLACGGLTAFLGDGSLRYGAERAAELYYDARLGAGVHLAADVQRVVHPGYDAARGPVSFYGLRLHREG
jgi:hypothetical protein